MLLSFQTLLEKYLTLYSLPGRFPVVILKEAMLQLLSGIQVNVGLTLQRDLLEAVLEECSQGGNDEGIYSVKQIRQAIGYLSRASVRRRLTLNDLYDPTFLDIPLPISVNVIHFGLPYLPKPELETLYAACKSEFRFPTTKSIIKHYWEETYGRSTILPDIFEHIWGLVDIFDTEELLPDGFFEVSWLFSMRRRNCVLPNSLSKEMRELFWEHCTSILPQLSVYKQHPTIIETMDDEEAVLHELSGRLIDQLQKGKSPSETVAKEMTKSSKRMPKTASDNALAAALRQTLEALSGWKWKSDLTPPEVTELEYEALQEGIIEFSETFFKFDWNGSIDSDWNSKALRSFIYLFKERVKRGDWTSKGITETSINNQTLNGLVKRKWLYLQSLYQKQRIRLIGDQQSQDALELEEKMRKKKARHVSRRAELYRMRITIIEAHPEWNKIWRTLVETLGVDGMSSDETDEDISSRNFRRIHKVWRNPEVTLLMEHIDSYYGQPDFRGLPISRKGNMRRKRYNGDHPEIVRTEITNEFYPQNFYNLDWLEKNQPEALDYLRLTWGDKIELPVPFLTSRDHRDLDEEEEATSSVSSYEF